MASSPDPSGKRGPYRSGEDTRRTLLQAALTLFADHGFEAVSIRTLALKAKVASPAIAYHFGSKEEVYLACADHVVARYRDKMQAPLLDLQAGLSTMTPDEARAALVKVCELLVAILVPEDDGETAWLAFMVRELGRRGIAHDRLYDNIWRPGLTLMARLVARIGSRSHIIERDRLEALLLMSTPSVFAFAPPVAANFGKWPSITRPVADQINAHLARSISLL